MARENDLLTDAELIEFTGYQKASKQREILDRGGVSYIPDREGRPMVMSVDTLRETPVPASANSLSRLVSNTSLTKTIWLSINMLIT